MISVFFKHVRVHTVVIIHLLIWSNLFIIVFSHFLLNICANISMFMLFKTVLHKQYSPVMWYVLQSGTFYVTVLIKQKCNTTDYRNPITILWTVYLNGRNLADVDGDSSAIKLRHTAVFKPCSAINSWNLFLLVNRQLHSFISSEGRRKTESLKLVFSFTNRQKKHYENDRPRWVSKKISLT